MPGEDRSIFINQYRVVEPEPPDAGGNLSNLLIAMSPRIAKIGAECPYGAFVNVKCGSARRIHRLILVESRGC